MLNYRGNGISDDYFDYGSFVSAGEVEELEEDIPQKKIQGGFLAAAIKLRQSKDFLNSLDSSNHAASTHNASVNDDSLQSEATDIEADSISTDKKEDFPEENIAAEELDPIENATDENLISDVPSEENTIAAENEILEQEAPPFPETEDFVFADVDIMEFENVKPRPFSEKDNSFISQIQKEKLSIEVEKQVIERRKKEELLQKKMAEKAARIKRPIGAKLIFIISAIIVSALLGVTLLVSFYITDDIRRSSEENNLNLNKSTSDAVDRHINNVVSSVNIFTGMINAVNSASEVQALEKMFFERNSDIVAVYLPKADKLFTNKEFFLVHEITDNSFITYTNQESDSIEKAENGELVLNNAAPYFGVPVLGMFFPMSYTDDNVAIVLYSTESMGNVVSSGSINKSQVVNLDGDVLVTGDFNLLLEGADEKNNPIVKAMNESLQNSNGQITYKDENGKEFIGAFHRLNVGTGAVITEVSSDVVLEGVRATTRRNIFITFAILSLSILIVYFFSKSLSRPLKLLTSIVNEINKGNFNTDLFNDLRVKNRDEIGVLASSTMHEREILNTFTKLTNKGVTRAIITKEIDFEPHLKDITIFFSDIRGFTAISDGFKNRFGEQSAAEIINFLNDYMSRMVTCINRTGGTVDKFEGDAIMACWGVLRNDDLSWENLEETSVTRVMRQDAHDTYVKDDALSAITCCIAMRYSLMKYNKEAEAFTKEHEGEPLAKYKPHIRIGAGLNSGRATVGFMGSFDKMEFTSIGDPVNFASRTEASNKPCGTDILITEDTYALLKMDYIRCKENNFTLQPENEKYEVVLEQIPVEFEVKGKGKQHFYGVVNMPNFDILDFFGPTDPEFEVDSDCEKVVGPKGPKTLSEMRVLLGIPEPDFGQVDLDAEENKVQVSSV